MHAEYYAMARRLQARLFRNSAASVSAKGGWSGTETPPGVLRCVAVRCLSRIRDRLPLAIQEGRINRALPGWAMWGCDPGYHQACDSILSHA